MSEFVKNWDKIIKELPFDDELVKLEINEFDGDESKLYSRLADALLNSSLNDYTKARILTFITIQTTSMALKKENKKLE